MKTIKRNINQNEKAKLDTRVLEIQTRLGVGLNFKVVLFLFGISIASGFHIFYYDDSNWSLLSKLLIVTTPIGIWVVIQEYFKQKKNSNKELNSLVELQESGQISVMSININRIAKLQEHEDEGDLYLIENKENKCIYLWGAAFLPMGDKEFPSEQIEVYVDELVMSAINKRVNSNGKKLNPILVSTECKWAHYSKVGFPEELQLLGQTFDDILLEIEMSCPKMVHSLKI